MMAIGCVVMLQAAARFEQVEQSILAGTDDASARDS
jgi:hypothetical protein